MKSLIIAGLTAALLTSTMYAAVPDLTIRLETTNIVKVTANVPVDSTWILEGAPSVNGQWSQLVTLKPSGYQIAVTNAPAFLRLHRGNEIGAASPVFRSDLGIVRSGSIIRIYPVCPLPPGRWTLQETSDFTNWTARVTFENSGWQKDVSHGPSHLNYRLVQ